MFPERAGISSIQVDLLGGCRTIRLPIGQKIAFRTCKTQCLLGLLLRSSHSGRTANNLTRSCGTPRQKRWPGPKGSMARSCAAVRDKEPEPTVRLARCVVEHCASAATPSAQSGRSKTVQVALESSRLSKLQNIWIGNVRDAEQAIMSSTHWSQRSG
jgi:hypothetical protein